MSEPNILQQFNLAYRHSLARLTQAGQQVDRGWWLLNDGDAWAFLSALQEAENAQPWQVLLKEQAVNFGLPYIMDKVTITGLTIRCIYEHETTCVLQGKKD